MKHAASNPVGWFEIPVTDMERAMKFYHALTGIALERHQMGPLDMAWFPMIEGDAKGANGALVCYPSMYEPSGFAGTLIYFTAHSGDVSIELDRAVKAGGKILQKKKDIGEYGFVAFFEDSEGNRMGLHARK